MKSVTKSVFAMQAMTIGLTMGVGAVTQERELRAFVAGLPIKPEDPSPDPRTGGRSPA